MNVRTQDAEAADFEGIVGGAGVGLAQFDHAGRHTFANAYYCRIMGLSAAEIIGCDLDQILDITPAEDEAALIAAIRGGGRLAATHGTLSPRNADAFPAVFEVSPVVRDGHRKGAMCTIVDLTDRAKTEQAQDREIGHRVRNIFAIVQAIVAQTLRGVATPREVIHALNQRIGALSGVNTLMMRSRRNNVSIREVVEGAVSMHRADPDRIVMEGDDDVEVNTKAALAISLALHELCTNAIRCGALSNDDGRITITWSAEEQGAGALLRMAWMEQDGPAVTEPTRKGLGTRLIVESLSSDVQGRSELMFLPTGARWVLEAPLHVVRD